jgi:hypothetical protein
MYWHASLLSAALLVPYAHALLRFPCSQLVTQRLDPCVPISSLISRSLTLTVLRRLVTPGVISPHVHQIIGGVRSSIHPLPSSSSLTNLFCSLHRVPQSRMRTYRSSLSLRPTLTDANHDPIVSTSRCAPSSTSRAPQRAPPAASKKTSRTTGRPFCTLSIRMGVSLGCVRLFLLSFLSSLTKLFSHISSTLFDRLIAMDLCIPFIPGPTNGESVRRESKWGYDRLLHPTSEQRQSYRVRQGTPFFLISLLLLSSPTFSPRQN